MEGKARVANTQTHTELRETCSCNSAIHANSVLFMLIKVLGAADPPISLPAKAQRARAGLNGRVKICKVHNWRGEWTNFSAGDF